MDGAHEHVSLAWHDYLAVALRRRWWLVGPFFVCGLLAFATAQVWPELYRSEALILVEQQKVPEQYVTPNVVTDPRDRLQSMTQQILSRTRLRRMIEQFGLYGRERARMAMDDIIDKMRDRIRIELVQAPGRRDELTAFRIYFSDEHPRVAQQITNEITSLFIEENLRARTQQSSGTTDFLENQLGQAKTELAEQEERQRQYKMKFLGQLPEQQQSNLQILSSLEAQLRSTTEALERAEQQRVYLESIQTEYKGMRTTAAETRQVATGPTPLEMNISETRKELAESEARYTPQHPDVVRAKHQLTRLEAQQKVETAAAANVQKPERPPDPAAIEAQSRLKALAHEIENHRKDAQELRDRIRNFQARLDLTPVREQQLAEVTRSYENSREYYQSLLKKKLQSELATNLEKRQQGEQFRVLDPATLPQKPIQPNRFAILMIGWAIGLGAGIMLTAALEVSDKSLRTEDEVMRVAEVPVLAHIPIILSQQAESRLRRRHLLEAGGVALGVTLSIVAGIHTYLMG